MKTIFSAIAFFAISAFGFSQEVNPFFKNADDFFKLQVNESGGVDYAAILADREGIDKLVKEIHTFPLASADVATKKAFWINTYNLLTIFHVLNNYPIKSPTAVDGFWDKTSFSVAGEVINLSDIENKKIRPVYNDPRFHFVLVCAGKGCPPLLNAAYMPSTVDQQLEDRTKQALNNDRWTLVDAAHSTVQLSEIFKWYEGDFAAAGGALAFVNKYRNKPIPADYKLSYYTYDWSLNQK